MANLLMHPRADSLTFLFTTQSGCEGESDEKTERGRGRKKNKQNAVFLSIDLLYLAHTVVVVYNMPLSKLLGFAEDGRAVVDIDKNEAVWCKVSVGC